MKHHIEKARSTLGELGALASKTEQSERNILKAAETRLDEVQKSIKRLRVGVESAGEKEQDRYTDLIDERGKLNIVIARSRKALNLD